MGDINTNIRIDELESYVKAQLESLKSDVSKLKTNNVEAIEISLTSLTGTITTTQYNFIANNFDRNRNFHIKLRYLDPDTGVPNYYICGSYEKLWDSTNEVYDYVAHCGAVMFYVYPDKSYELVLP